MSRIFPQAMSSNECRPDPFFFQYSPGGYGDGKNRGLSILGQPQLIFWAFKTELREFRSKSRVGLVESLPRDGKFLDEVFPHADCLRALSGKQEGNAHSPTPA